MMHVQMPVKLCRQGRGNKQLGLVNLPHLAVKSNSLGTAAIISEREKLSS